MKFLLYICVLSLALSGSANAITLTPKLQQSLFQNIQGEHVMFALSAALGAFVLYQIYLNPAPSTGTDSCSPSNDSTSYNSDDTHYHVVQTTYSPAAAPVEKEKEKEEKKEEAPAANTSNTTFEPFTYDQSDPELEALAYLNNQ